MSWMKSVIAWIVRMFRAAMSIVGFDYVDRFTSGVPNLHRVSDLVWRCGQPADEASWSYLRSVVGAGGRRVLVVKLNYDWEGDDSPAESFPGWTVLRVPLPPDGSRPWTILAKPSPEDVDRACLAVARARSAGESVVLHCTHGRDRTGLVAAIVLMRMFGWTKQEAWGDMMAHGFRWVLPDLDAYWIEDV